MLPAFDWSGGRLQIGIRGRDRRNPQQMAVDAHESDSAIDDTVSRWRQSVGEMAGDIKVETRKLFVT
jgi:hypothetical protein